MEACAGRISIPSFWHKAHQNNHHSFLNRNTGSLKPDMWLSGYWTGGSERPVYVILPDMFGYYLLIILAVGTFTKIWAVFAYGRVYS